MEMLSREIAAAYFLLMMEDSSLFLYSIIKLEK